MLYQNILDTIGNTPLVKVGFGTDMAEIWVKLEMLNPSGSIKDKMALFMVEKAGERGILKKGMTILEATTGNTGISFAMIAVVKGYKMIAVMPEDISVEKQKMIKVFGGEVILTPSENGPLGAIQKRDGLAKDKKRYWFPNQFENQDNILSHEMSTGQEIVQQMETRIDAFVAGVGTGGTLIGVARAMRARGLKTRIVAVEPEESAVLSGEMAGSHNIEGIGEGFVPKLVRKEMIDEVIKVSTKQAISMVRRLACEKGILAGISSGANMVAAIKIAKRMGESKRVVTIFPDRGERYLGEGVFNSD